MSMSATEYCRFLDVASNNFDLPPSGLVEKRYPKIHLNLVSDNSEPSNGGKLIESVYYRIMKHASGFQIQTLHEQVDFFDEK